MLGHRVRRFGPCQPFYGVTLRAGSLVRSCVTNAIGMVTDRGAKAECGGLV